MRMRLKFTKCGRKVIQPRLIRVVVNFATQQIREYINRELADYIKLQNTQILEFFIQYVCPLLEQRTEKHKLRNNYTHQFRSLH